MICFNCYISQVSIKSIVIMSPSVGIRRHSWRLLGKIEVSSHSQFQFNRHHQRLKHNNKIVIKVFKTSPCVLSTEDAASWMTVTKEVCKLWTLSNCYTFFDMSKTLPEAQRTQGIESITQIISRSMLKLVVRSMHQRLLDDIKFRKHFESTLLTWSALFDYFYKTQ